MNGDIFNPECDGIEGVVDSYKNVLDKIKFNGPTYFHEILKVIVDMAES